MIKLQVSTADVLPVTNSMSSSDQMSTNDYTTCGNTIGSYTCECNTCFTGDGFECADINECDNNPCDDSEIEPTALVHSAAHVITDNLVMDSLVLITTNAKTVFNG